MERPQHSRSVSDNQRRTSDSSYSRQMQNPHLDIALHLPQPPPSMSGSGMAGRRRHVPNSSMTQNRRLASDGTHSRPLSPFEERFLGRGSHVVGIPLAEPVNPSASVTEKFISSVRRAVSLKKERTPVSVLFLCAEIWTHPISRRPRTVLRNSHCFRRDQQPRNQVDPVRDSREPHRPNPLLPPIGRHLEDIPKQETSS